MINDAHKLNLESSNNKDSRTSSGGGRNRGIDFVSGVLIIYMIFCHVMQWSKMTESVVYLYAQRILFFFMPWFFFKSGLFVKPVVSIKSYIVKNFKLLILPSIYFSIMGIPIIWYNLILHNDYNIIHYTLSLVKNYLEGSVPGNLPLWFLLSLFLVKFLFAILNKMIGITHILVLSIILVIFIFENELHRPITVVSTSLGLLFYCIAKLINSQIELKKYIIPCCVIYFLSVLFFPQMVDFRTCTVVYGNWIGWIIVSLAGCIIFNKVFNCLNRYLPSIIVEIGKHSMSYYVCHWLIISYTSFILNLLGVFKGEVAYILILFISLSITLPLLARTFNKKGMQFLLGKF